VSAGVASINSLTGTITLNEILSAAFPTATLLQAPVYAGGGTWELQSGEPVLWLPGFGADPTGVSASDTAMAEAISAAASSSTCRKILCGPGTFMFNSAGVLADVPGLTIAGAGPGRSQVTTFVADFSSSWYGPLLQIGQPPSTNMQAPIIRDLCFESSTAAGATPVIAAGIGLQMQSVGWANLINLFALGFGVGIWEATTPNGTGGGAHCEYNNIFVQMPVPSGRLNTSADGSTVSGSKIFNSPSMNFTSADIGCMIRVIGTSSFPVVPIPPLTFITAVNSSTQCVMSNAAFATASGTVRAAVGQTFGVAIGDNNGQNSDVHNQFMTNVQINSASGQQNLIQGSIPQAYMLYIGNSDSGEIHKIHFLDGTNPATNVTRILWDYTVINGSQTSGGVCPHPNDWLIDHYDPTLGNNGNSDATLMATNLLGSPTTSPDNSKQTENHMRFMIQENGPINSLSGTGQLGKPTTVWTQWNPPPTPAGIVATGTGISTNTTGNVTNIVGGNFGEPGGESFTLQNPNPYGVWVVVTPNYANSYGLLFLFAPQYQTQNAQSYQLLPATEAGSPGTAPPIFIPPFQETTGNYYAGSAALSGTNYITIACFAAADMTA